MGLQEPNDSGIFPNPKSDNTVTCFHEFQDWMDVASTKACVSMANRCNAVDKKPSKEYTSKSIIEQNHKFANGADHFDNWTYKNKETLLEKRYGTLMMKLKHLDMLLKNLLDNCFINLLLKLEPMQKCQKILMLVVNWLGLESQRDLELY